MNEFIEIIFTVEGTKLNIWQATIRAMVAFILIIFLLRLGKKRFLGKNSPLDFILAVIVGSIISRSINGSSTLTVALACSAALILLHYLLSLISVKSELFSKLLQGRSHALMQNGKINYESLKQHHLEKKDILEAARIHANVSDLEKIEESYLELNGVISVIKKDSNK